MFLLPANMFHSPQRPAEGSVGLVIERERVRGREFDALTYFCANKSQAEATPAPAPPPAHKLLQHEGRYSERVLFQRFFYCEDLGTQLVPVIQEWASRSLRQSSCHMKLLRLMELRTILLKAFGSLCFHNNLRPLKCEMSILWLDTRRPLSVRLESRHKSLKPVLQCLRCVLRSSRRPSRSASGLTHIGTSWTLGPQGTTFDLVSTDVEHLIVHRLGPIGAFVRSRRDGLEQAVAVFDPKRYQSRVYVFGPGAASDLCEPNVDTWLWLLVRCSLPVPTVLFVQCLMRYTRTDSACEFTQRSSVLRRRAAPSCAQEEAHSSSCAMTACCCLHPQRARECPFLHHTH